MQRKYKKLKLLSLLLLLLLGTAGVSSLASTQEVQAATAGFKTVKGKTYYYNSAGKKQKGWLTLNGKKYYFNKSNGVMVTGWVKVSNKYYRYFSLTTGEMVTGWIKNSKGQRRYFSPSTGYMQTKWKTIGKYKYYFYSKSGIAAKGFLKDGKGNTRYFDNNNRMLRGWVTSSKGAKRYFETSTKTSQDGVMAKGFKTIDGKTYYFYSGSGVMATGWVENKTKGVSYYFDPNSGEMAVGTMTIEGKKQTFSSKGVYTGEYQDNPSTTGSTGSKTIKNYLAGALKPVGSALYVWGGGWNDSTRKGLSSTMTAWYEKWLSNPSGYDYNNYRDLSSGNRAKGFDCSGFVGWAAYQVMQTKSNVGSGYTVVSGDIGSYYSNSLGWGSIINQSYLSQHDWKLKPGDIGYNAGHTWIVLGQCKDKSVVIVHSTPNAGVQISGTCTPSGNYSSEAISLAKKYMAMYPGFSKYSYHTSSGNYIRNGNYLRWNSKTLSDPNGYANMTAAEILYDLFGK